MSGRIRTLAGLLGTGLTLGLLTTSAIGAEAKRPNVLIVITDDQGHGDLGLHGNPVIKTPNLDRLGRESIRLTHFYVSPVCAPTRSSLLTGRYNYRTGVVDTFQGRAMMHTDEITLAEMLKAHGYRTGIFGKWHLGDSAPMRPIDQGFDESLVHKGGGIGQASDPPGGTHYFDPILQHHGKPETRTGYCSDIYTDAAIDFITNDPSKPFFAYLAFNAPHVPLEVPDSYRKPYAEADLSEGRFPKVGQPLGKAEPKEVTARVYGMITNIDDNLGRLFKRLDDAKLADDTLVIFLTDNGPQQVRYNSGMRGRKTTVYEGGIRVPCFLRWPGRLKPGKTIDRIAAHIDLTPTVLEACGIPKPSNVAFDGVSLWPLVSGGMAPAQWPDRTLFFQWHRGDAPEKFRAFAAREQQFKLVRGEGPGAPSQPAFELFDIEDDPFEQHDRAADNPEVVERLKAAYEAWFSDVSNTRGYDAPRIWVGSDREEPVVLTRQDWRGADGKTPGHWEVDVKHAGPYRVKLRFPPGHRGGAAQWSLRGVGAGMVVDPGVTERELPPITLTEGPGRLDAWFGVGDEKVGVWSVEIARAN